ncbi:SDR family NAD(P)-dependent oxidoreductase [Clostridium saccharobutylicum]|uniref:Polyketide synthase PksJ n=1 Tax=Clostridium saccharobutylicum TaxID=169679 RepID=A0A1S8ND41_CLOSA|nr:SDR family NAD(P)-dependent oxidoreductase [Clostridium saccharobutylicum]OOM14397.1 polyketide synthase PksJ [Clostridium saccharobutylicum]
MSSILEKIQKFSPEQKEKLLNILKTDGEKYNIFPLSSEQNRMWYLYKIDKDNSYYNVVFKIDLNSDISCEIIKEAIRNIVEKNSALRTQILEIKDNVYQSILKFDDVKIPIEFFECDEDDWEDVYNDVVLEEKNKPFDLENEIPIRFKVYELSDETKKLIVSTHHMFTDGWSMGILRKDFEQISMNLMGLKETVNNTKRYSYIDYVKWQNKINIDEDLKYWKHRIENTKTFLSLPTDYKRSSENRADGKSVSKTFSVKETEEIKEFAKTNRVSVFTVFLSCYYLTLSKMCNQYNIAIGTPVFNRIKEQFHNTIGFFANTIVLTKDIRKDDNFLKFLKDVHDVVLEGMEHQSLPFDLLVEKSKVKRENNINPIFQAFFNMESEKLFNNEDSTEYVGPVEVSEIDSKVQFDIIFGILERDKKYSIGFSYKTCLFSESTMLSALTLYRKIIKHYIRNAEDNLSLDFINASKFEFQSYEEEIRDCIQKVNDISNNYVSRTVYCDNKYFVFYISNEEIDLKNIMLKIKEYTDMKVAFIRLNNFPYDKDGVIDNERLKSEAEKLNEFIIKYDEKNLFNSFGYYEFENNENSRELINENEYLIKDSNNKELDELIVEEEYSYLDGGKIEEIKFKTLDDLLLLMDEKFIDKKIDCIQFGGELNTITYKELLKEAEIASSNMKAMGIKEGAYVVLQIENLRDFIKAFWGTLLAGAIVIPLGLPPNLEYRSDEAASKKLIRVSGVLNEPYLICGEKERDGVLSLGNEVKAEKIILNKDLFIDNNYEFVKAKRNEKEVAMILFTSGSTGIPKGVQLSHRNIIKRSQSTRERYKFTDQEVSLNWMPLDHVCGILMCHICDTFNASEQIHVASNEILKDPLNWLILLDKYKATMTWAPNFAYGLVLEQRDRIGNLNISLENCKFIVNAGEAINYTACNEFMERMKKFKLPQTAMYPSWGMTETCSCMIFSDDFGKVLYKNSVAVGIPNIGTKAKIVDENMNLVPCGKIGKLFVGGETINQGYYKNDAENKKCFTSDGWFDTGDLATIKNGEIVITGRCKDILIVNGVNVSCLEIEKSLEEIDGLMSGGIACCPIQNEKTSKDKIIICYSITEQNRNIQNEIHKAISQKLVSEFGLIVDGFIPVEESKMPRTSIGKIEKTKIREGYKNNVFKVIEVNVEGNLINNFYSIDNVPQKLIGADNDIFGNMIILGKDVYKEDLLQEVSNFYELNAEFISLDDDNGNVYENIKEAIVKSSKIANIAILGSDDSMELVSKIVKEINSNELIGRVNMMVIGNQTENCTLLKGYLASAVVENSNIYCKLCITNSIRDAIREFKDKFWIYKHFIYVQIENNIRKVEQLIRFNLEQLEVNFESYLNKTYVVLGGMGGIGYPLCKYLLDKFNCNLVVVGRKDESEVLDKLNELSNLGNIKYYKADLSREKATLEVLSNIYNKFGDFDGIINLIGDQKTSSHIGNIEENLIKNHNKEIIENGIKVRKQIIEEIDKFLENKDNKQVVILSSITGLFGGNSFGLYSSSSSYLLYYQLKNKNNKLKVIASTKWRNIGMSEGDNNNDEDILRQIGYDVFEEYDGIKSLIIMMASNKEKILMGINDLNYKVSRYVYVEERFNGLTLKENYQINCSDNERNIDFENRLRIIWKKVIKRKEINVDDKFFEVGGNSLKNISLMNNINQEFNVNIPITDLFKYSTIRQMARRLTMVTKNENEDTLLIEI